MKRYIIFLPLFIFFSCSDFLEKPPLTNLSESSYWAKASDAEYAVNGLYECFYELDGGAPYYDILTDLIFLYANWEFGGYGLTNGSLTADNSWINSFWSTKYKFIRNCNFFFDNVEQVKNLMSEDLYNDYCGQARTIRAFLYLRLLQGFGDIPLITTVIEADAWPARDDSEKIIDFIMSEFDLAINELPDTPSDDRHGRIYKDVARAYKARAAMYIAGFFGKTEYYQTAVEALKPLVENASYALWNNNPDPTENFTEIFWAANEGSENKEIIFSDQFMKDKRGSNISTSFAGPGWKGQQATQNYIDLYECKDGWQKYGISFKRMNEYRDTKLEKSPLEGVCPDYDPKNEFANRDPRLNATFFNPNLFLDPADGKIKKAGEFWVPANRSFAADRDNDCYFYKKLVDPTNFNPVYYYGNSDNNYPLVRLSDMYLLYAEALNETGQTAKAADYVNKVRARAAMPPIVSSDKDEMFEIIKHERKIELLTENVLYWDYKRWKEFERTMPYGAVFYGYRREPFGQVSIPTQTKYLTYPKYYLWPIPASEVRNNPNMIQNEGW